MSVSVTRVCVRIGRDCEGEKKIKKGRTELDYKNNKEQREKTKKKQEKGSR